MPELILNDLNHYRKKTYRLRSADRLHGLKDALDFINERGFIFFWPIQGIELPSLWKAAAGDRSVPNDHDDPGHVTWNWKDEALDKRMWYYGKILRRKATFISLKMVPYFYALSENYGSPEEDYLTAYREGRLTQASKQVFETLLEKGPLDTISLRKEARLMNAKESDFNRAIDQLQSDFKVLPVGIAQAGAWRYAFRYDITTRHFPELQSSAQSIAESQARQKLIELYFLSVGAGQRRDVSRLFGWSLDLVNRSIEKLINADILVAVIHPANKQEWLAIHDLIKV